MKAPIMRAHNTDLRGDHGRTERHVGFGSATERVDAMDYALQLVAEIKASRSDFAIGLQARRGYPAESSFLSYRLVVHLLLLSTTHRCVAVAFGYRPESVYLERTFTSLTTRAFRRTSPAFQRRGARVRLFSSRSDD